MGVTPAEKDVTRLLRAWKQGDQGALSQLMPLVYSQLRRLAEQRFRGERRGHTLEATALIHEAYLRLADQNQPDWKDRNHFFGIASHLMRQILVDHARRHKAAKRGAGLEPVELDQAFAAGQKADPDILALDQALQMLEQIDPEQSRIVEMRFFGGFTVQETALALGCSAATVKRKWQLARIWLHHMLHRREDGEP